MLFTPAGEADLCSSSFQIMADEVLRITSITQLHDLIGVGKPRHPLISVIRNRDINLKEVPMEISLSANLYSIFLKGADCGVTYGRNHYDFEEGVMVFNPPNQRVTATENSKETGEKGWMIFCHPDMIRGTQLGSSIDDYSFFDYDAHEALHLSDDERRILTDCMEKIEDEINQRIDNHSQRVIVSGLELFLNYCARFYERQFNTRSTHHKTIVGQVNTILKEYRDSGNLTLKGFPSVQHLADHVHLSPNYLSDLLKKETGRSAKDHISEFIVGEAKTMLVTGVESVSQIAYELGFNYPHYFSRLFKAKTGMTPQEFRSQN